MNVISFVNNKITNQLTKAYFHNEIEKTKKYAKKKNLVLHKLHF